MSHYTLYGVDFSYFTGKVRAYLRWKQIPFVEKIATNEVYRDVILPRVGFPVIPVMVGPEDETLQDTTDIIDELERRHGGPTVLPKGVQGFVGALLELYGDEWLVIPAMHYRWHHNTEFALHQFGNVNLPNGTREEKIALGAQRSTHFSQAAILLGGTPEMHQAIETSYEDLLRELDAHFAVHPYVLGTRPTIGDLGLYGPLYAHQYRDPYSGDLMRRLAPNLVAWVERLRDTPAPLVGELLPDDTIPETLLPVLRRQMREQLPVLTDASPRLTQWMAENPGLKVPRVLGMHGFELEGAKSERIMRTYSLWMMQRARDAYLALQGDERVRADALLEAVGGQAFRDFVDPPRLARSGMSVALA